MLKIRLTRRGKKNKAFFRLVVAEHASPIKGKFIEALGFLNPHTKEKSLKNERIKYWMEKGAQCSDSVHNMLVKEGILNGPKRAVKMKKKEAEKTEEKKDEKPASDESPAGKKEAVEEEIKSEEKAVPKEKPARIATQSVAGGEEKAEEPKTENPKPKEEKAAKELKEEKIEAPKEENEIAKKPARNTSQSDAGGEEVADPKEAKKEIAGEEKK